MRTRTFKTTHILELQLDIYDSDETSTSPKPVIVWIHGGALISGTRSRIAPDQLDRYLGTGFVVISIDYRLAPETKLPLIVEDVEDAIGWIRDNGDEIGVDPNRLAVIGHSAGGYLTLLTGHRINPLPKALISFYGYGDIAGDWYSKPDQFYSTFDRLTEAEAHAAVTEDKGEITDGAADPRRGDFYLWCRQNGLWPEKVGGHDPVAERGWFTEYSPAENVHENYPPTLLLHGDADTDVPYAQSVHMASQLADAGIESDFITIENGAHGFDHNVDPAITPEVDVAHERVISFLKAHV